MASQNRLPTSDESNTGDYTTAPLFSKVNDGSDSTLIVGVKNLGGRATFGFTAFSLPVGAVVVRLAIHYRARSATTSNANVRASCVKIGTTYYGLTDTTNANTDPGGAPPASNQSVGDYTFNYNVNPATGAAWTAADINGVGSNPLNAFGVTSNDYNPDVNYYVVDATAVFNYSITIAVASFGYGGVAVNFAYGRSMVAASQGFDFSGVAVGLVYGRTVVAETVNFPFSGVSAGFSYGRTVIAETVNFSFAGLAVRLKTKSKGINRGDQQVKGIKKGESVIQKIYLGNDQIWP